MDDRARQLAYVLNRRRAEEANLLARRAQADVPARRVRILCGGQMTFAVAVGSSFVCTECGAQVRVVT